MPRKRKASKERVENLQGARNAIPAKRQKYTQAISDDEGKKSTSSSDDSDTYEIVHPTFYTCQSC